MLMKEGATFGKEGGHGFGLFHVKSIVDELHGSIAISSIEGTGTQIKIDRIYVKRGAESFSSITFRTTKTGPEKKFASKRFWVKLKDANEIVADMI